MLYFRSGSGVSEKSTPGGTFRPGPLGAAVNGGRDRNDMFKPFRSHRGLLG